MKYVISILGEKLVLFCSPFRKHPVLMVIGTTVLSSILYVLVNIGLAELARQNSYSIHMLAAEQLSEIGLGFTIESKQYAEMLNKYTDHLERRHLAAILRVLYPTYSPRKTLASALSGLEKAENEEAAKKAIWEAGLASDELYKRGKRFPPSPIKWFESEKLPDWLVADVNDALTKSSGLADKLETEQTLEAAIAACRANRKAILLLFLARLGSDTREKLEEFLIDVKQARDCTVLLAENTGDVRTKEFLYETARSEDRRVKILEAMLANDLEEACRLLTEAIEKAYKMRGPEFAE